MTKWQNTRLSTLRKKQKRGPLTPFEATTLKNLEQTAKRETTGTAPPILPSGWKSLDEEEKTPPA